MDGLYYFPDRNWNGQAEGIIQAYTVNCYKGLYEFPDLQELNRVSHEHHSPIFETAQLFK